MRFLLPRRAYYLTESLKKYTQAAFKWEPEEKCRKILNMFVTDKQDLVHFYLVFLLLTYLYFLIGYNYKSQV